MAIVIPNASPAPTVATAVPADPRALSIGPAVERLGQVAMQAADDWAERDRLAELREARVAAAERLAALRIDYDQTTDWTNLSGRFESAAAAAGEEIGKGLSPRARADFDLIYREMRLPHLVGVREREAWLRRDHERGRLTGAVDALVAQASAAPDDAAAAALADQTADVIAEGRAAGWLTAEEEGRLLAGAAGRTAEARALRLLRDDPQALADRIGAGDYAGLPPDQAERFRTGAMAEVQRRADAEAQRTETAARAAERALADETVAAVRLLESGLVPDGLEELRARAAGTPSGKALDVAVEATRGLDGTFAQLPPARQAEALAEFRRTRGAPGDEVVLASMERIHAATIKSLTDDPLAHVARRGVVEVPPVDLSDPSSVRARVALAEQVAGGWAGGAPVRYFTADERAQYAAAIDRASPDDQVALAAAFAAGFGERAPVALGEIGETRPAFAHAGALIAATGETDSARAILAGQKLLDAKEGAKPKAAIRDAGVAELVAPVTAGDAQMRRLLLAAADAHFALTGAAVDPADEAAVAEAWEASVQAAAGGVMRGRTLYGGVQDVNGVMTLLPASLSAELAEDALDAADAAALAAASVGGAPRWGDGRPLEGPLDGAVAIYEGGGSWLVGRRSRGTVLLLADPTQPDGRFRIDLDLLANPPASLTPPPAPVAPAGQRSQGR